MEDAGTVTVGQEWSGHGGELDAPSPRWNADRRPVGVVHGRHRGGQRVNAPRGAVRRSSAQIAQI